jgi:hypothetical protein
VTNQICKHSVKNAISENQIADLRASLIAATVDVVTGVCWRRDEDGVTREYRCDDTFGVVTYAAREWQGEEVRDDEYIHQVVST